MPIIPQHTLEKWIRENDALARKRRLEERQRQHEEKPDEEQRVTEPQPEVVS